MEDVAKRGKTCGLKRMALCRITPCSNLQVEWAFKISCNRIG
jgi:hypothetical protein